MRDRLVIPILLPLLVVGGIVLTIFSFGHVLLQIQEEGRKAWPIAIAGAAAILLIAAWINAQRSLRGLPLYALTALPASIVLALGLFYLIRPGPEATGAEGGAAAAQAIAPPGPLDEITTDNKFSATAFTIVANQQYTFNQTNNGVALHNWHVLNVKDTAGNDVTTKLTPGGGTDSISFTIAQAGTYSFQCDVHPTEMKGTLTVAPEGSATSGAAAAGAGAATAGGGQAGPGTIVEVATDNKYALTQLNATANQSTTLTVQNKGAALHNVHVLNVKDASGNDVATKLAPGGASDTITFTIAQAGSYNFQCDVHPTEMKGTLTVK